MTDSQPQSALREIRGHLTRPATLAVQGAVILILTLVGPFGTDSSLRFGPRLAFWAVLAVGTFAIGQAISTVLIHRLAKRVARPVFLGVVAIANGIAVNLVVASVIGLAYGNWSEVLQDTNRILTVFAIAAIMTLLFASLMGKAGKAPSLHPAPPSILTRLPLEKRGALVALSVEDHYVRVRTVMGEEMLLLRLSDAMRETGDQRGLQVHRSHWVALDQINAARRDGDRAILTMTVGPDIPVSRSYIPALREAGLLPR